MSGFTIITSGGLSEASHEEITRTIISAPGFKSLKIRKLPGGKTEIVAKGPTLEEIIDNLRRRLDSALWEAEQRGANREAI